MPTTTCPNCGKPIRPGTRYCGNCGAVIPDDSQKVVELRRDAPEGAVCPYCGKPVRPGARYCNHCGKEISDAKASVPAVQTEAPLPISQTQAGVPPAKPRDIAQKAGTPTPPRPRSVFPFLIGGLIILCGLGGLGGFLFLKDPFGWQKKTPIVALETTSVLPTFLSPRVEEATATIIPETQIPSVTVSEPVVSATAPELPPVLVPLTVTIEPVIIPTFSGAIIATSSAPPDLSSTPIVLLRDDFSGSLGENWKTWGNPRPSIQSGPDKKWLNLTATEKPGSAGVTSRLEIENAPGVRGEFSAQLNPIYPQYPLILDWDPYTFDRGPDNSAATIIRFELQKSGAVFQTPVSKKRCKTDLDGLVMHRFTISFTINDAVELFIDDSQVPACTLEMGFKPSSGRISFTGTGWVTQIVFTSSKTR